MRTVRLNYNELATFVIAESDGYRGSRAMAEQHSVDCIFIQSISFSNSSQQETRDADAIIFPNPDDAFISENFYRLEGMYVMVSPFGASGAISWYRIESVTINRDHLLTNSIDNIECLLKKTEAVSGVS